MAEWAHELDLTDLFHHDHEFSEVRDTVVQRIRFSDFYDRDDLELVFVVSALADSKNEEEFNSSWDAFYDWADEARVWVATLSH